MRFRLPRVRQNRSRVCWNRWKIPWSRSRARWNHSSVWSNDSSVRSNDSSVRSNDSTVRSNDPTVRSNDSSVRSNRSTETLRALGSTEWAVFLQDPVAYLGGDGARFRADVLGALGASLAAGASGTVAVFTHGLPINVVLSHALGLQRIIHFAPGYGSLTRLRLKSVDAIGVISVNELGHQDRI